ncbi:MAG: MerR family transcriptional regulator [Gemmatimonadetes bacterium]|uniref:MerR family transcriptional regulator n=1 Tax=Candidatus Kutchimonas denitrificans TaxID=3056748 RepID=A0AAE4ZAE7_9BACT|nr:MerR family transcriptional regulator [Gemmatimonadota bacterium]NIR76018.1 MerR family transcriptional regulator [Candidatus Kutchimonas denitrificans]NIS02210.1 MerR family transcriptional regulator [Gemmatimonadota bacterium]NIT68036.1 MerR family transcriptional regulator [Gemmatimonadota bacterium]NIU54062.1 MerR family transcriptional regulator [Gemmatimonadota bacterium]
MSVSGETLSIREIARRTDLPESTLRYYRTVFGELIPTFGSGRRRRHPEEAIPAFQLIARMFAAGESRGSVRRQLQRATAEDGTEGLVAEPVDIEPESDSERSHPITVAAPAYLPRPELEDLLAVLLIRDRELASMHRELLEMVGQLLHALGRLADVRPAGPMARTESAIAPPPAEPGRDADGSTPAAAEGLEAERLRETLARERETVERLRKARLDLERRVARLEREKKRR